jgi:WD40 repeat protein
VSFFPTSPLQCLFYSVVIEPKKTPKIEESVVTVSIKSKRGKNAKGHKITGLQYFGAGHKHKASSSSSFKGSAPRLLVSTIDSRIRLYCVAERKAICKYKGHINTGLAQLGDTSLRTQMRAHMTPDQALLASPSEDGSVYVWSRQPPAPGPSRASPPSSLPVARRPLPLAHTSSPRCAVRSGAPPPFSGPGFVPCA